MLAGGKLRFLRAVGRPPCAQPFARAGVARLRVLEERWAATFTEDGTVLPPNGAAVQGRAAIQAWAEAFPPVSDFQATIVAVDGRGDLAYIRGTYSMNLNIPGAPAPIADRGKYISIWQKQADGSWLAVHDIFNSDLPMAPAPAAAQ